MQVQEQGDGGTVMDSILVDLHRQQVDGANENALGCKFMAADAGHLNKTCSSMSTGELLLGALHDVAAAYPPLEEQKQ